MCSTNLCTQCSNPQFYTSRVAGYVPSGSGCLLCANSPACVQCQKTNISVCQKCNNGYYLVNGQCRSCPSSNCKRCTETTCLEFKEETGQFAIEIDNVTVPAICDPGCLKCSTNNVQVCVNCMEGYSKNSESFCVPCDPSCKTCMSNQPTSCLSCYGTAFLSQNTCVACTASSNCLTCQKNNLAVCTACPNGFNLNANKTCSQGCPDNCLSCESGKGCTVCISGYAANSKGVCLPCLSNCRGCSSQANGVCINCGRGFFLNSQGACSVCPNFCTKCTFVGCEECMPGYTMTSNFQCVPTCTPPCATCSNTNPTSCQSCIAGYTFNNSSSKC